MTEACDEQELEEQQAVKAQAHLDKLSQSLCQAHPTTLNKGELFTHVVIWEMIDERVGNLLHVRALLAYHVLHKSRICLFVSRSSSLLPSSSSDFPSLVTPPFFFLLGLSSMTTLSHGNNNDKRERERENVYVCEESTAFALALAMGPGCTVEGCKMSLGTHTETYGWKQQARGAQMSGEGEAHEKAN